MHSLLEMIATCTGNADRYFNDPPSALQMRSATFS